VSLSPKRSSSVASHVVARQLGLAAVVDPHVPVDVEPPGRLGHGGHPALAQGRAPLRGLLLAGRQVDLGAQGAHLQDAIEPQEVAPLARGAVAQRLDRCQPRQGHEGEQQQQTVEAIVALGQRQMTLDVVQQPHRQQGRQRT
jgi:hypothetical protein